MKKSLLIWIGLIIIVVIISFFIFASQPYYDCDTLRYVNALSAIGSYKDFSYAIAIVVMIFIGWLAYDKAEENSAKMKEKPSFHVPFYFIFSYVIVDLLLILIYLYSRKSGWFSLDITYCEKFKNWWVQLIKYKSVFGTIGVTNFYIAHSLDVLALSLIIFIIAFYVTKFIKNR